MPQFCPAKLSGFLYAYNVKNSKNNIYWLYAAVLHCKTVRVISDVQQSNKYCLTYCIPRLCGKKLYRFCISVKLKQSIKYHQINTGTLAEAGFTGTWNQPQ